MKKKQSAHSLILNTKKTHVLLVKRRDIPVWVLPGGGIDDGESPLDAAQREAEEETGLKVSVVEKIATYFPRNALSNISHIFECTPIGGQESITCETRDIAWYPIVSLPRMPPPYPEWITDATTVTKRPFQKTVVSVNYWAFCKNVFLHPILMLRFILSRIGIHLNN